MFQKMLEEFLVKGPPGLFLLLVPGIRDLIDRHRLARRKILLRRRVLELSEQRELMSRIPGTEVSSRDLQADIDGAVAELTALVQLQLPGPSAHSASRDFGRRLLLLYRPHSIGGWVAHTVFFLVLSALLLGFFQAVSDRKTDLSTNLMGATLLLIMLVIIRGIAGVVDERGEESSRGTARASRSLTERLTLFYRPSHPVTWLAHLLFYFALTMIAYAVMSMVTMGQAEKSESSGLGRGQTISVGLVSCAFAGMLWGLARRLDRNYDGSPSAVPGRRKLVDRMFLLYMPMGIGAWLVHVLFFLFLAASLILLLNAPQSHEELREVPVYALPALVLWVIARLLDRGPRNPAAGM